MGERPILNQFNLVVRDVEASVMFYRRLGLDIPDTVVEWQRHHRSALPRGDFEFDVDSEAFARIWDRGWSDAHRTGVIGFSVSSREEVDRIYREMTDAGYGAEQGPYDAFWGARYAVIRDPDGNAVGLMSPVDPSMRSDMAPPESSDA